MKDWTGCELKTGNEVNLIQKNTYNSQGQRIKKEERRTEEKQAFGDINSGDSTDSGGDSGEGSGDEGDDPDPDADDPDAGTAYEGETEPEKELVKESREYFYQGASLLETRTEVAKEALTAGASETTEATGASNSTSSSTTGESGTESESFFNLLTPGGNIISAEVKKEGKEGNEEDGLYLYNRDEQGSTSSIIDSEGKTAAVYDYDEYGNTEVLSGDSFGNELCYTGQVRDKSTGLYYYNARFYDSSVGSFTSQDSYRGEYNNPLTQNLYTYCAGDPVNRIDPTGHSWLSKKWAKFKKAAKKKYKSVKKKVVKAAKTVVKKAKATIKTGKKIINFAKKFKNASRDKRIEMITGVSKKKHYARNQYNKPLPSKKIILKEEQGWEEVGEGDSACHQFNRKDGKPNKKFVNNDTRQEIVFYYDNTVNNTPEDMGTYNFCTAKKSKTGHFIKDVLTWYYWANSPNDKTTKADRREALAKGLIFQVPKNEENICVK